MGMGRGQLWLQASGKYNNLRRAQELWDRKGTSLYFANKKNETPVLQFHVGLSFILKSWTKLLPNLIGSNLIRALLVTFQNAVQCIQK